MNQYKPNKKCYIGCYNWFVRLELSVYFVTMVFHTGPENDTLGDIKI